MEERMPPSQLTQPADTSPVYTLWSQQFIEELSQWEHDLRGDSYDSDKNTWESGNLKEVIAGKTVVHARGLVKNEAGIRFIISCARTAVLKSNVMSYYDEFRIYELMLSISNNFAVALYSRCDEFGIESNIFDIICDQFNLLFESSLRRALRGREADNIYGGGRGQGWSPLNPPAEQPRKKWFGVI